MCDSYVIDQPEAAQAARESADHGAFEVVVLDADDAELGTLDRTFSNDFDATMAAREAEIPDIGVSTEIRDAADETH
ncbi:hypothetical protein [Halohasta litorea]|uniref:Uncharacterized protein n=1 Tax=Halohasta litorea TaxID=869891 RepID=A0ABD6DCU7_9EURY|nr:hypothetical protein [Halohasta litorea]